MFLEIFLPILIYCLIGAIVEFLFVFSVLMYAKRHSNSDEQFIKAWNKASDIIIIRSLFNTNSIKQDVASAFQLHILTCMFIWPFHLFMNIIFIIGTCMFHLMERLFDKLASILLKR